MTYVFRKPWFPRQRRRLVRPSWPASAAINGVGSITLDPVTQLYATQLNGLTWPSQPITWGWAVPGDPWGLGMGTVTNSITDPTQQAQVIAGLNLWANNCGVQLLYTTDITNADIQLGYANCIAGLGLIAQADWYYSGNSFIHGLVLMEDPALTPLGTDGNGLLYWTGGVVELRQAACHEFGILLGLAEGQDPNSVESHVLGTNNQVPNAADIKAIRYLYGPDTGISTINGIGNVAVDTLVPLRPFATVNGTGGVSVYAVLREVDTATINGVGSISAGSTYAQYDLSETISGVGSLVVRAVLNEVDTATINGVGGVNDYAVLNEAAYATLSGVGSITATAYYGQYVTQTISGVGSFAAYALLNEVDTATINGVGSVTVNALVPGTSSATLAGAGSVVVYGANAPKTSLHYAAGNNFDANGNFQLSQYGFNLADASSLAVVNALPAGVQALVYLGYTAGADATFQALVTPFIGNPKVWGYYIADEPDPTGTWSALVPAANLKAESDWIHTNDPGKPTFIVLLNLGSPTAPDYTTDYAGANTGIDYFGIDAYPVRDQFPGGVDYQVINARVNTAITQGYTLPQLIPVYQAFGGGGYPSWTMPTVAQERLILQYWGGEVPNPAFDYVYEYGVQLYDTALSTARDQLSVFALHNGITTTFLNGESTVSIITGTAISIASATISGVGGIGVYALLNEADTATLSGQGSVTVSPVTSAERASILINGQGSITTNTFYAQFDLAEVIHGIGSISVSAVVPGSAAITLNGTGNVIASAVLIEVASAAIAGTGSIAASSTYGQYDLSEVIAGVGGISAYAVLWEVDTAIIAGVGSIVAGDILNERASATISGVGGITIFATSSGVTANLAGVGSLAVNTIVKAIDSATLPGVGSLTINTTVRAVDSATLAGSGSLAVQATLQEVAVVALAGVGAINGTATHPPVASTTLAGVGSIALGITTEAEAAFITINGVGSISLSSIGAVWQASANLVGVESLSCRAVVSFNASTTLAGTGSLTAFAAELESSSAVLSGLGYLTVEGSVPGRILNVGKLLTLPPFKVYVTNDQWVSKIKIPRRRDESLIRIPPLKVGKVN